jgi:niacin transporter
MGNKIDLKTMITAALLCAVGIIIPILSPVKFVMEPASFTLASHVALFIAMFISPFTAAIVAVGTSLGFLLGGFPIVIVARAATHIVFALIGAIIIRKKPSYWMRCGPR